MLDGCCIPCFSGLACGGFLGALFASPGIRDTKSDGSAFAAHMEKKVQNATSVSDLGWLNEIVEDAWPRVESFLQDLVRDQIEPMIDGKLPGPMKGAVKFMDVRLGRGSPDLGPVIVQKVPAGHGKPGFLRLQIGVNFCSELHISITALRIPIGLKQAMFRGTLTIELSEGKPLANKPPFFGSVVVYFVNVPEISLDFTGLANVADMPMLHGMIRGTIKSVISNVMVMPARIAIDLNKDDDVEHTDLRYPDPIGVLKIVVKSASDLTAADMAFLAKNRTSDPYVTFELGRTSWTSPTVKGSTSPTWPDGTVCFLPVYSREQRLQVQVYDEDKLTADDLLGEAGDINIEEWLHPGEGEARTLTLKMEDAAAGAVQVETSWLVLPEKRSAKAGQLLYLAARVGAVKGLPPTSSAPFTVHMSVEGHHVQTRASHPEPGAAPIAQALRKVCENLAKRRLSADDIADITDLDVDQVKHIVAANGDPTKIAKAMREATKHRAATTPRFDEVIHLLLPAAADLAKQSAQIELKDKSGNLVVPPLDVPLVRVLPRSDQTGRLWGGDFTGPFLLQSPPKAMPKWQRLGASFVGEPEKGMQLDATLSAKWLQDA